MKNNSQNEHAEFYKQQHRGNIYAPATKAKIHPEYKTLIEFIDTYKLKTKRCLEIGCARAPFQDLVKNYTGVDIAKSLKKYIQPPKIFVRAYAEKLPFKDREFDAIWSIDVLEHVPNLVGALNEMDRVLKKGGYLYLRPAWHVPKWVASGISVRPYSDLSVINKIKKALLPIRNSRFFKGPEILLKRIPLALRYFSRTNEFPLYFNKLRPDYKTFWTSDSDACNYMDLFASKRPVTACST